MRLNSNHTGAIQIIGTQRSGSNLLRLILNQSPEIVAPHPPHILDTLYPLLSKYGSLTNDSSFSSLVNDVCRLIETNPVEWDIELDRTKIAADCNHRSLPEIFRVIYSNMANKKGARYWCCKSMNNVNYFRLLEENTIKPYYIHLMRDGRDIAASFKNILVGEKHPYHLAQSWKKNYLKAIQIEKEIGAQRFITIKYESLITNPEDIFEELNQLLGIKLTPNALQFFHSPESIKTAKAGFMWRNVTNPIMSSNHGHYIHHLTDDEIEIFERVAGDILLENGYALHSTHVNSEFTKSEIACFQESNIKMKENIGERKHLLVDKKNRSSRQLLLDELCS